MTVLPALSDAGVRVFIETQINVFFVFETITDELIRVDDVFFQLKRPSQPAHCLLDMRGYRRS